MIQVTADRTLQVDLVKAAKPQPPIEVLVEMFEQPRQPVHATLAAGFRMKARCEPSYKFVSPIRIHGKPVR
jgi:hypothetical protein